MVIEIVLSLLVGVLVGTFTGLAPGIHINLVAALLLASLPSLGVSPLTLSVFIAALAVTHTLIDFIPSIYLGAPSEDTFLSVLPGHELLREGKGHEAVVLALYGSLFALLLLILLVPLFIFFASLVKQKITLLLPFILIAISLYMVMREKKAWSAFIVFALSGFLGFATLNLPVKEPLLPLLTGLFGASTLIVSLRNKITLEKQHSTPLKEIRLSKKEFRSAAYASLVAAPPCSFLPALGSGYASLIGAELFPQSRKGFIFLNGTLNTTIMITSFVLVYSTGNARTGAAAAIETLLAPITSSHLFVILGAAIFAAAFAFASGVFISKLCASWVSKINYQKISLIMLVLLFSVTLFFSRPLGLLVFFTAAALGVFAILSGVKRTHLMGSLLVLTILHYLF